MGPLPLERFPSADMAADRAAYEWLATQPPGPMIELPLGDPDPAVRYQFRTLIHGNRIVNGYSGYGSALQDFLRGPPSTEGAGADQLAMFRALGLRYVVIHGQLYGDANVAQRVDRGHARPDRARRPHDHARFGHDRRAAIDRPGEAAATGRRRDPARLAHAVRIAQRRRAASGRRRQRRDAVAERHAAGRHRMDPGRVRPPAPAGVPAPGHGSPQLRRLPAPPGDRGLGRRRDVHAARRRLRAHATRAEPGRSSQCHRASICACRRPRCATYACARPAGPSATGTGRSTRSGCGSSVAGTRPAPRTPRLSMRCPDPTPPWYWPVRTRCGVRISRRCRGRRCSNRR